MPLPLYPQARAPPPRTHWIEGWVDSRAGLDDVEKKKFLTLPGLELRPLGRPARSQSLSRLLLIYLTRCVFQTHTKERTMSSIEFSYLKN
jgi:hypothetical protein